MAEITIDFGLMASETYRQMLEDEFKERHIRNRRYSYRAMARDLGVSSAFMSQLMTGKRILSESKALELLDRLGWDRKKQHEFVLKVRLAAAKDARTRAEIEKGLAALKASKLEAYSMTHEIFKGVMRWFAPAIIELIDIAPKIDSSEIAKRLKITKKEVDRALSDLEDAGLIERSGNRFKKRHVNYMVHDGIVITPQVKRILEDARREELMLSQIGFTTLPENERRMMAATIAVDESKIAEAHAMMVDFLKKMMAHFDTGEKKKIFHFNMQFFRLDRDP